MDISPELLSRPPVSDILSVAFLTAKSTILSFLVPWCKYTLLYYQQMKFFAVKVF